MSRVGGSRAKTLVKDVKVLKSFSISMGGFVEFDSKLYNFFLDGFPNKQTMQPALVSICTIFIFVHEAAQSP